MERLRQEVENFCDRYSVYEVGEFGDRYKVCGHDCPLWKEEYACDLIFSIIYEDWNTFYGLLDVVVEESELDG